MNDDDSAEIACETPFEFARRMMFAYLAGIMPKEQRLEFKSAWEKEHAEHSKRHGACPMCETMALQDAMSLPSSFLPWLQQ